MMTKTVMCAICGRSFDSDAEGGFTNNMTGKSVCTDCAMEHSDETARLMVER